MKKDQKKQQVKNKEKQSFSKIMNNPISIIIVLIIFSILLMVYNRYLVSSTKLYTFSGFDKKYSILNGTIYTSRNINYFGDSKIYYNGDDIKLSSYEIGYYIKKDSSYQKISVMTSLSDSEFTHIEGSASLKELLQSTDFSFTETSKEAVFMSKSNMKQIDKLIFKIYGKTESGEDVDIEIPLDVQKISK